MVVFLLIRHGENDYLKKNKLPGHLPGIHLNERGREQADELARTLGQLPIKAIYSSPLERAVETAQPLAKALDLEIQLQPGLIEIDVGEWSGRSWKALARTKTWQIIQKSPSRFRFPGGESFVESQARIVAAIESILGSHKKDEMIAAVFHADPIKVAVAHYLGLPLDNFQKLTISAGSVTALAIHNASGHLLALNLIPPFATNKLAGG